MIESLLIILRHSNVILTMLSGVVTSISKSIDEFFAPLRMFIFLIVPTQLIKKGLSLGNWLTALTTLSQYAFC